MLGSVKQEIGASLERFELKYLITSEMIHPIQSFAAKYCDLDYYSANSDDRFYTVNSLYVDSPGYEFLKRKLYGRNPRFNMRLRSYGENPNPPYFAELKYKTDQVVTKYRAPVDEACWHDISVNRSWRALAISSDGELYSRTAETYSVEPKILTQYRRCAFASVVDDYARLTIDKELCYRLEDSYCLQPNGPLNPYDSETLFATNEGGFAGAILELKCYTTQVPLWMLDMIRYFELQQAGFSKYAASVTVAMYENGEWADPGAREVRF